jgi:hypothetical protein
MMKRIYITGLIFSFMFATTGYPVTLHLCNMMEEASSSECSMCIDTQIPERMPCCEEDNVTGETITSGNFSGCCDTQLIDNKVEDEFLFFKQEVKNDDSSLIIIISSTTFSINNNVLKSHSPYAFDSSPPSLENNLYISNSVLLI